MLDGKGKREVVSIPDEDLFDKCRDVRKGVGSCAFEHFAQADALGGQAFPKL